MHAPTTASAGPLALALALALPSMAGAQFDRIRDRVVRGAADEVGREAENIARDAVRCVFDDLGCIEQARKDGNEPVLTDKDGKVVEDKVEDKVVASEDGQPEADRDTAAAQTGPVEKPGSGAWANYDFIPGDWVLFAEDFEDTTVGDFPRRLTFVGGNWEVVEWQGRKLLRSTGGQRPTVDITLPEALPETFTIEFEAHTPHGNMALRVTTEDVARGSEGNLFRVSQGRTGVEAGRTSKVQSLGGAPLPLRKEITPVRIMVDGTYAKVYVNEERVANVPNARIERGRLLRLAVVSAYPDNPFLIDNIRVAAGGRKLYDVLEADGRASTQGIYFATNSDVIRPESTPTLKEIGEMLKAHQDLRLSIEGHTDSDGDDASNLDLSRRRAAAVKAFLIEAHGIDAARLESVGHGESKPVAANDTPAGKQQNRRVELVKGSG